jgi:hypothetical protein
MKKAWIESYVLLIYCCKNDNRSLSLNMLIHEFLSSIDTGYYGAYISEERMKAFQFTNAYTTDRSVAVYSQEQNAGSMMNFSKISAGISLNVYIIMVVFWCALIFLFAIIERVRPSCEQTFRWCISNRIWIVSILTNRKVGGRCRSYDTGNHRVKCYKIVKRPSPLSIVYPSGI